MNKILGAVRLVIISVASLLCMVLVATAPATAADAPPYDPSLGRTPYQPDKMLVDPIPGDAMEAQNSYGFNLSQYRGLTNPAYYELFDNYTVKLYRNRRGLPESDPRVQQEKYWLEGLDRFMSTMVLETNKWVGGRLKYVKYTGESYLTATHPPHEISITFDPQLRTAKGITFPGTQLDNRGIAYLGAHIDLVHVSTWDELISATNDGDRKAKYQVALVVMHEMAHAVGLNHYGHKFHGEYGLMSGQRLAEDVSSWNDVLTRGDKAGLMAMAGWRSQAKRCAQDGACTQIWEKGNGVAWPPNPPDHRYDRVSSF